MTAPVELRVLEPAAPAITRERYAVLARRVKVLSWLSLAWMSVEGAVALVAGIVASSIALVGFGLDSVIEGVASVVIIWRFTGARVFSHAAEQRAQKLVAAQFFLLAPYVAFESIKTLVAGEHPDVTWVGIGLAVGLLIAGVAVKEGTDAWRGEGCCVGSPLDGAGFADDGCHDPCCHPAV